ncbi:MAG: hypothetical protein GC205_11040 [Bacteroidetes bacterium]|nr:hypothetical protein [Bacteroidota bacterium]
MKPLSTVEVKSTGRGEPKSPLSSAVEKEFTIGLFGWDSQPGLAEQLRLLLQETAFALVRLPDHKEPSSGIADALIFLTAPSLPAHRSWSSQWPVLFAAPASELLDLKGSGQPYGYWLLPTDSPEAFFPRLLEVLGAMTAPGNAEQHFRFLPSRAQGWLLVIDSKASVRKAGEAWSEFAVAGPTASLPPPWELLNIDPKRWAMFWNAVRSGSTVSANAHPVVRPDGHLIYLDWELVPGLQAGFGPAAAVFFAEDVSGRVRAEQACVRLTKERDWLQKDMDQFVEAASHDLKEPLRNVSNFVQLLRHRYGEQLGGEGADYISYAVHGVKHMWALMDELLLFANLGKAPDRYGWMAPQDLLADAMVQLDQPGTLRTNNLPEQIFGHPAQLALLFRHLLDNGFRYNPQNGREVVVEGVEERNNWILSVWDNGPGIAPEFQLRAFSLFKRLHGQDETPGRGMGLSICRKVVALHGGHIRLASERGTGTALHIWLPKAKLSGDGLP